MKLGFIFTYLHDDKKILFNLFRHFSFPQKNKLKAFKKNSFNAGVDCYFKKYSTPLC